ncbi:hypothetical protein K474DRAFT_1684919 [Panus rudis PR-1116 ss-1]|nr:hypothetical protein K474DRAFT_1684919 [Panus rudis PR-1116 ss-1]
MAKYEDPSFVSLPSNDMQAWYYPTHGYDSDADDDDIRYSTAIGNWGRKHHKDARWIRRGKMAAWAPGYEEWESEDRARKRLKLMLPQEPQEEPYVRLPHLRSPSPPVMAPYPPPTTQHTTYTSFVMDQAVTHTFRSRLLDELEQATNSLIEGETTLRRALGRLLHAINEDPDRRSANGSVVPKREEEGDGTQDSPREQRAARAPDLTPAIYKHFLTEYPGPAMPLYEPSQFTHPAAQLENLEKSLASLRDLHDDGREYVERLEEIREDLGTVRTQKDGVWVQVRERALKELQDAAHASAG